MKVFTSIAPVEPKDNMFLLFPISTWEFLISCVTAIGGLIALIIAVSTYLRNSKSGRESQARLVYSSIVEIRHFNAGVSFVPLAINGTSTTTGAATIVPKKLGGMLWESVVPVCQAKILVHNKSQELIGPVKVQMINVGNGKVWETFSVLLGTVEPNSSYEVEFVWENEAFPGQFGLLPTIIFRDSNSAWWRRKGSEPIEKVHEDPENSTLTPWERAIAAKRAEELGWAPSPEPKVSVQARIHRLLRKLKGKSPIP